MLSLNFSLSETTLSISVPHDIVVFDWLSFVVNSQVPSHIKTIGFLGALILCKPSLNSGLFMTNPPLWMKQIFPASCECTWFCKYLSLLSDNRNISLCDGCPLFVIAIPRPPFQSF